MHLFDTAGLPASPWKNGGGSTREIVCRPEGAGLDGFDWRVSIATITQAGPFSAFPGMDRVIMLLDGDGVRLRSTAGVDHRLDRAHAPFAFSGDLALDCALLGGPSTDFNVMTRRGALHAEVRVLRESATLPVSSRGLLLVLHGTWQLPGTQGCAPGQGVWWDGDSHGGQVTRQDGNGALAWVRLSEVA